MLVAQGPPGSILLGVGRHRIVALVSIADAVLNLTFSLLLVRPFGMMGVAAGTGIPVVLLNLGGHFAPGVQDRRRAGCPVSPSAIRPAVAGAIPAVLLCVLFRVSVPPQSIAAVLAEGALVGCAYVIGLVGFGVTGDARARYDGR